MSPTDSALPLEFRPFDRETELSLQRDLFRDAFPEAVGTSQEESEHYNWKFQSFPDSPSSYEYGAYYDGKMVGYYAAIPYRYKLHGKEIKSAMVCDVMTHSSMRGKGIFTKLGAYALDQMTHAGLDISFGYPIRPEVIPGHIKVGWQISGKLPLQLKVLRVDSALKSHPLKFVAPLINLATAVYGAIFAPRPKVKFTTKRYSISEFLAQKEALKFLEVALIEKDSTLIKDPSFIKWRYGAPKVDYTVIGVMENGKMISAAFVRKAVLKEIPTLSILDLIVLDGKDSSLSNLFFEIEKLSRELKSEMIATMITAKKAVELGLFRFGFIRSPFVFQLISRGLAQGKLSGVTVTADVFNPMWVDSDDL